MHNVAFCPIFLSACVTPTAVVVLPSPAAVGLIPVTRTSFPRAGRSAMSSPIFALYLPYRSRSSAPRPKLLRDVDDRTQLRVLCDLDV